MLSHGDLFGSGRLEGVRGGAMRLSVRCAVASSVGRFARGVGVVWREDRCAYGEERGCGMDGRGRLRGVGRAAAGEEDGPAAAAAAAAAATAAPAIFNAAALRSVWRRFWNQIVTTLGSLCGGFKPGGGGMGE
jgi:hypothetical protein